MSTLTHKLNSQLKISKYELLHFFIYLKVIFVLTKLSETQESDRQ